MLTYQLTSNYSPNLGCREKSSFLERLGIWFEGKNSFRTHLLGFVNKNLALIVRKETVMSNLFGREQWGLCVVFTN